MPQPPLKRLVNAACNHAFARIVTPRLDREVDPLTSQQRTLKWLLARAKDTRLGKAHHFAQIRSHADFIRQLPILSYEHLWERYWAPDFPRIANATWPGPIRYFAQSSGTSSGNTKRLPLSPDMLRANRRTALEVMARHQRNRRDFAPFDGRILYLGGATRLSPLGHGAQAGDLSAIASRLRPRWVNGWFAPPYAISNLENWRERYEKLLDYLAQPRDIQAISGVPMWIHKLLLDVHQRGLPGLDGMKLIIHGGASIAPYLTKLEELAPPGCVRREVYPASEGFVALDDGEASDWRQPRDLRLNLGKGLFFEFIPAEQLNSEQPERHWLGNAETGRDYALILNTNAGLFGYPLGDLVRLVSLNPPRLRFVGRTAWYVSQFGEHLSYADLEAAIAGSLAPSLSGEITEWCFGVILCGNGDQPYGHHKLILETTAPRPGDEDVTREKAALFDAALQRANADYAQLRTTPFLPHPPQIKLAPPGSFDHLLTRLGMGGGQSKVPRMIGHPDRFARLLELLEEIEKGNCG